MLKVQNAIQRNTSVRSMLERNKYLFLLIATNLLSFSSELVLSYKSNSVYFFENSFRITYLCFYVFFSLITYFSSKYGKIRHYLFFSIFFFLPILFDLKALIQAKLFFKFVFLNLFQIHLLTAGFLILLMAIVAFISYKGVYYKYLISFLFFWNLTYFGTSLIQPHEKHQKQLQVKATSSVVNRNIYVLLFDEYPNMNILDKYEKFSNQHIKRILAENKYTEAPHTFSNYTNTEASTTSILTGQILKIPDINQAIDAVTNNVFTASSEYSFYHFSIFDDLHRPNSVVSIQFFKNINNFSIRYVIPYILSIFKERGIDNFYNYGAYNKDAIEYLETISKKKDKHVMYVHFFTPHSYPLVEAESIQERIYDANSFMHTSINLISKNDSLASVIILSDHGLRKPYIPESDHNKNLLFYKNISLDTAAIRREGIVAIFKNFSN